ncbi:MAG: RHS repeat-associated core domain-containing protein [Planctomycetota bacterium]
MIQDKASGERIAEFDDQGRLLEETKNGVTTRFVYDEAGRVVQRKTPEGLERFAYDADGNLTSLHGPQGGLELAYENGKLVRLEASPLGLAVEHRYDARGNKVASKLPWGEVHYAYDEADRLTGVQTPAGDWIRFELDAQGRRVAAHYPGGVDTTFAYTGERLSSIVTTKDGETLEQRVYGYSFDGTVESVETTQGVTRFTHDAAGQLIEAKGPQGLVRYAYDAMGNRTAETVDGETIESVYGEGNRIVKRGETAFTHHPNGAIASKGEASYRYTSKGQLAEVSYADGSAIRYGYAPNGTRLWREDQNGKTFYLPGLNGTLGEFDQDRTLVTGYVLGGALDEVLAASHGAEQVFYHVDLVRSVTAMTTAEGKLAASFDYDAFGRELAATGPAAEWNQIRYASRPVDLATGDYDYRARTYAPELGRFTSPDPVSFLGGVNLYAYVENALALNDPLGLFPGQGLIEDAPVAWSTSAVTPWAWSPTAPRPWAAGSPPPVAPPSTGSPPPVAPPSTGSLPPAAPPSMGSPPPVAPPGASCATPATSRSASPSLPSSAPTARRERSCGAPPPPRAGSGTTGRTLATGSSASPCCPSTPPTSCSRAACAWARGPCGGSSPGSAARSTSSSACACPSRSTSARPWAPTAGSSPRRC